MSRYQRQIILPEVGSAGQQKLADAKVLVIGAGGLGCPVLQNLAAAGVGCLGIVDGDVVEESNLHRQLIYTAGDCGKNKAITAANALKNQNPEVQVVFFATHFCRENAFEIVNGFQIIVDCTDNIAARYLMNDVALASGIPMVFASIHRFEGQLSVFNYQNGPTYRCLFPEPDRLAGPACDEAGVLGVIPNVMGVLQATEVLKILLGLEGVLSGKLLLYNGLDTGMETIRINKKALEVQKGLQNGLAIRKQTRSPHVRNLTVADFQEALSDPDQMMIELREHFEDSAWDSDRIQNVPLDELQKFMEKVPKNQKIILLCRLGNKSELAANYMIRGGFTQVFHLRNGLESLRKLK